VAAVDAHAEGNDEQEKAEGHDASKEGPADHSHYHGSSHQAAEDKAAPGATVHR
jgi:hypothetical protein